MIAIAERVDALNPTAGHNRNQFAGLGGIETVDVAHIRNIDLHLFDGEIGKVAALHAHGVETFVFCSYAHKAGMATELNEWLARTARAMNLA